MKKTFALEKYISKLISVLVFLFFLAIVVMAMPRSANASGTWDYTGSLLQYPRYAFQATALRDGRILIEGGYNADSEIYDPISGTWASTGNMGSTRAWHTATLLQNGTVLAAGGFGDGFPGGFGDRFLSETYDPNTGLWTRTGEMANRHVFHTATLMPNGKVLIAGDQDRDITDIYDPATRTYSFGGFMTTPRSNHIAVLLNNGKVLLAGGGGCTCGDSHGAATLSSAELYDPSNGSFTSTGSMNVPRSGAGAALLTDGRVLVAGGNLNAARYNGTLDPSTTAEIYDPNTGLWILTGSMHTSRLFFGGNKLVPLPNGAVMAADGDTGGTSETYNSSTGLWDVPINLRQPQCFGATAPLPNGKVLLVGGTDCVSLENRLLIAQIYRAIDQLTDISPAKIWIGLKNSDDVGIKFDLLAEVYKDGTQLVGSGELDKVIGGSSGFNNAHIYSIPLTLANPVDWTAGATLSIKLSVRNTCFGNTHNSGTARLWFNDSVANSHFGATIGTTANDYFLLNNFILGTAAGVGPKSTIDVAAGAPCSSFKPFGTWVITP